MSNTMKSPTGHDSASSNAAMNLFQKFSDMQQGIESARKERGDLQQAIEKCRGDRQRLRSSRNEEDEQRQEQSERINDLNERILDLQEYHDTAVQTLHKEARRQHEALSLLEEQWKTYKQTVLESFLDDSRDFRSTCKRLQVEASANGLRHAGIRAAVLSWEDDNLEDIFVFDGIDDEAIDELHVESIPEDPSTWKIPKDDDEMQVAMQDYLEKKRAYHAVRVGLEGRNKRKDECVNKASSRSQRIEALQRQLDRIIKENTDAESQIQDLDQLTEEAKVMASSFEEGVKEYKSKPKPVAVTPYNPYTRTNSSSTKRNMLAPPQTNAVSSTRHVSAPESLPQHQPHNFLKRTRWDRQFGSNLVIAGGHVSSTEGRESESTNFETLHIEEDDDDDDDELLSYVAFGK